VWAKGEVFTDKGSGLQTEYKKFLSDKLIYPFSD
jgi:hypothetical protein